MVPEEIRGRPYDIFRWLKTVEYTTAGNDVQFAVIPVENGVVVAWEESASRTDWKVNFDFPVRPYRNQKNTLWYHRGWAGAYKSARDAFLGAVAGCPCHDNVWIYGWSYGGAMSQISAEDIRFHYPDAHIEVVTFGSPNPLFGVRTRRFVSSCIDWCRQYADRNDCVAVLPPFPLYGQVNKVKVGSGFSLLQFFNPAVHHTGYGEEALYGDA